MFLPVWHRIHTNQTQSKFMLKDSSVYNSETTLNCQKIVRAISIGLFFFTGTFAVFDFQWELLAFGMASSLTCIGGVVYDRLLVSSKLLQIITPIMYYGKLFEFHLLGSLEEVIVLMLFFRCPIQHILNIACFLSKRNLMDQL